MSRPRIARAGLPLVALTALVAACTTATPATGDSTPAPAAEGGAQAAREPLTVREVLAPTVRVGDRVRVTGQCRGYSARSTLGTPPVSRSDWELAGDGAAVWVNGALPDGCSVSEGSEAPTTIDARVAEDTLRALGPRGATPRRYLVRVTR